MKAKMFVAVLFATSFSFAEESTVTQAAPFYPLHVGDQWEFRGFLSKAMKDTVMPNGKTYMMILHSDTILGATRYERTDSNKVFRFNPVTMKEELWFDFNKEPGDTVNVIPQLDDTISIRFEGMMMDTVIGRVRNLWCFSEMHSSYILHQEDILITDSLGIVFYGDLLGILGFADSQGFLLTGAIIDGKLLRKSYPSIYLPLQPGNWWTLNGMGGSTFSVAKDTLMPNGKIYANLIEGYSSEYLRQEKNYVFRYVGDGQEEVEMDFSAPAGQVYEIAFWSSSNYDDPKYTVIRQSSGISSDVVFSQSREVYSYGVDFRPTIDDEMIYTYADSIGLIEISNYMGSSKVSEANVNGKHYSLTSVELRQNIQPKDFSLLQNYPNPFNPTTIICYRLPEKAHVTLKIYDVLGQEIATLVDGVKEAGNQQELWNAMDVAGGIYFYRLHAGRFTESRKMVLLK